jgi:hypothetical protein
METVQKIEFSSDTKDLCRAILMARRKTKTKGHERVNPLASLQVMREKRESIMES